MDFDSWVFTIALTLCVIAFATYKPIPNRQCEIYHEANKFCTTYNGERMHRHTN